MSKLVEGLIPANTECPFKDRCNLRCNHLGKEHPRPLSCGAARMFDLLGDKDSDKSPKKE
jgi:hypothetical protein